MLGDPDQGCLKVVGRSNNLGGSKESAVLQVDVEKLNYWGLEVVESVQQ